jgi:hypothetical protein
MTLRRLYPAVSACLRMKQQFLVPFCLVLLLCFSAANVGAQTANAAVNGQITDAQGRVVPGTAVQAVNIDTNVAYPAKTNGSGIYAIPALPPGRYRLVVLKDGFKEINKTDIILNVQDILEQNFTLEIGSTSESITVSGSDANVINTTDGSVSTVINRQFVADIPLNGRSFQDLISMTPGVSTQSPQNSSQSIGYNGDFSINGQRTESNYYMIDGVSGNSSSGYGNGLTQPATGGTISATTALGTTQSLISVDALQEFRVESSTYSAEYGRAPGGQISFATRSGTNILHGTVFDYLRNNYFDANDWFNDHYGVPLSPLRQNNFGGTVGGPIVIPFVYNGKNRTFFFASYEGLRLSEPQAATLQYVPSTALRQSAASAIVPILDAFPVPTGPEVQIACDGVNTPCPPGQPVGTIAASGLGQFVKPYSLPAQIDSTSIRIDHTFTPWLTAFFRFGMTPSSAATRDLSSLGKSDSENQAYTIGTTLQLSHSTTNETRLGYTGDHATLQNILDNFGGATPTTLATAMGIGAYTNPTSQPYIDISGVGATYITQGPTENKSTQWNLVDSISTVVGHHQLRFGIDYRRIISPLLPYSLFAFPYYSGSEAIISDSSSYTEVQKYVSATPIFNETSAFAQDNWHVAPRLTLSFGLRWEINPPPTEAHGEDAYTLSGNVYDPSALTLAPRGTPLWKTSWFNFAPRLGAAWTIRDVPGWETVIRTGGGVFFDSDNEVATEGYSGGLGFQASKVLSGISVYLTPSELAFQPQTTTPYSNVYAFPLHLQLPYSLQWNATLEQSLGRQQAVTLSYVASNGRRLIEEQEIYLEPSNPNFSYVLYFTNGNTSNYQSLQAKYQRSVAHGLQALASYTWSHSIDFGSNDTALPYTRGNSDFDVRHNLQGGLNWEIPSPRNLGALRVIFGQWGLDARLLARTGFPITLNGKSLLDAATGQYYHGGVSLVPGRPIYLHGGQYPGGRALNGGPGVSSTTAAFILPVSGQAGNAPRNFARGFGENQVNLAARRTFELHESLQLQFRAEAFNILNHPNFGLIDPTLTDAQFGQATKMLNGSLGTVAAQYQQGGARSMQFALKFLF